MNKAAGGTFARQLGTTPEAHRNRHHPMSDPNCIRDPRSLPKRHDHLICVDSDGTVFDTMPAKQRCFCDCLIRCFGFRGRDAECAASVWNDVNLRSVHRGENRFRSLLLVLDILRERGTAVPDTTQLREWTQRESRLGNPALQAFLEHRFSEEMGLILRWSRESDEAIAANVCGIAPFPHVREVLEHASACADIMVVSHTPCATLEREWREHVLSPFVMCLGGQECGSKTEQIRRTAEGRYAPGHVLMIGDSSGDLRAAAANRTLFFPVVPGREPESWRELADEGLARFFAGSFAGVYQKKLTDAFQETWNGIPTEKNNPPI